PISIQTNSMNGSSNSLHSAGNENNNIAPNKNIKSDYFGYNQPQHPSTNNCPANSFSHNAQRFNKGVMDNNNNVKFRKPLNNNNNSKHYQNISHDNNSNIFRMNSVHNSPLLKKNDLNKSNTAILNMGNNKANANYMNADNISNKTNLEQKNNNLYKRSNS
ncbi:hypothetical protein HELRODRAFT_151485, partial [Helobdella robusta]|uniref:Uncharacterized protein n=1 Tax=Helobdella robusta TaxID=6412 RepID=T1EKK7_HELRO